MQPAEFIPCTLRELTPVQQVEAAQRAIAVNPVNRPNLESMIALFASRPKPEHLAVMVTKYWGVGGVKLTVGFMDNPPADLRARILLHMNAWSAFANVQFVETNTDAQVRINRGPDGYYSFLGPDILSIPRNQPTMNLQGFTMQTPESEFIRVVRHETGHTLGFPHEHMRREIVSLLDPQKTIAYFGRTQGWSPQMVRAQVLTPLEESALLQVPGFEHADAVSIMTYQLPGSITKSGQPIQGGSDIDAADRAFVGKIYPGLVVPPPPPPPPTGTRRLVIELDGQVTGARVVSLE